jgi:iron complex transport system substrate-binding protein
MLAKLGLPAAAFDPRTLGAVHDSIVAMGTLCGRPARARELVRELRRRVERIKSAVARRRSLTVYAEVDGTDPLRPWVAGPRSHVGQLVRLAGGNVVDPGLERAVQQVNAEAIIATDPDVILLMSIDHPGRGGLGRLEKRPAWRQLRAVREGRVIDGIHADLLSRPGPRLVDGLEALARKLHPEAFSR